MTVSQLRKILKGLHPNMPVVIGIEGESIEDICVANAEVITFEFEDDGQRETVLVLPICTCDLQDAPKIGEINSQPELN